MIIYHSQLPSLENAPKWIRGILYAILAMCFILLVASFGIVLYFFAGVIF